MARILGIDYGGKRLGVAVTDESCQIASPIGTIERKNLRTDILNIKQFLDKYHVSKIVIGLPLHMDVEQESRKTKEVKGFVRSIEKALNLPIELFDERLSTQEAETILLEADLSRKKRKRYRDKLAASIILQRYLDEREKK